MADFKRCSEIKDSSFYYNDSVKVGWHKKKAFTPPQKFKCAIVEILQMCQIGSFIQSKVSWNNSFLWELLEIVSPEKSEKLT